MRDSDYYAPGSYNDPHAPWNEEEVPEREFEVTAELTVVHETTVTTNKYVPEYDDVTGEFDADTWDTDFDEIYDKDVFSLEQLMDFLKDYAEKDLASEKPSKPRWMLKRIIHDCEGWDVEDIDVTEA